MLAHSGRNNKPTKMPEEMYTKIRPALLFSINVARKRDGIYAIGNPIITNIIDCKSSIMTNVISAVGFICEPSMFIKPAPTRSTP